MRRDNGQEHADDSCRYLTPLYGRREFAQGIPKKAIPEGPMPPDSAYQLIRDELTLDGTPSLNVATFVNTWADDWGRRLVEENLGKNFIDHEEYPQSNLVEKRIIWMLGDWYGTEFLSKDTDPDDAKGFYGSATIGSSEAVMLGLITHCRNWQTNNKKNPNRLPLDKPFVLMGTHIHSCFDKYCKYYNVGALYVPMSAVKFSLTGEDVAGILNSTIADSPYFEQIMEACEYPFDYPGLATRTVGELVMAVGGVVGTTYTGNSDEVDLIGEAIEAYCERHSGSNVDIPIHVDAASGGFILPFTNATAEKPVLFDFRDVARVKSINVSNHKFGGSLPGMGSVIFRDDTIVDQDYLVYDISYLGGHFKDFTVNFSRGSSMILLQYYNLLRWGKSGYGDVISNCMANAHRLIDGIANSDTLKGLFRPISDNDHYPICVFTWAGGEPDWSLSQFAEELRTFGWIVASYQLPTADPDKPDGIDVFRVVVRQVVSADHVDGLVSDMEIAVGNLENRNGSPRPPFPAGRL